MLNFFPRSGAREAQTQAIWIDLCNPIPGESAEVEGLTGLGLPSRDSLSEIESSSRLRVHEGVLSMGISMVSHDDAGSLQISPIGFVLSRDRLVTIRFGTWHAFDVVAESFDETRTTPTSSLEVFIDLCDEIISRLADSLEHAATELRKISVATFHAPDEKGGKVVRSNRIIRAKLRHIGRLGDRISESRDALLGVGRAVNFACELTKDWSDDRLGARMKSLQQDVASLDDYQVHLSDKVQFLLDAMVGLIGIAQNDVFKVLTIVSIVGIPPTLIAGIYGMNFKNMPEYNWALGYPYGLAVIALSAILPLGWFKWRGWF
jgi:magnesium transporter